MNPYEMFGTDKVAEEEGVWQNFGDFKVLLARAGGKNTEWYKELHKESQKAGKATYESLSEEERVEIIMMVYCKTIILDHQYKVTKDKWEQGVFIQDGGEGKWVAFTVENMKTMLEQLPDYFKQLQEWSSDYKTFQEKVQKVQEKNS